MIKWESFVIRDLVTGEQIHMNQTYNVPWLRARQIRQIQERNYTCNLVAKQNGQIIKLQVHKHMQSSARTESRPDVRP